MLTEDELDDSELDPKWKPKMETPPLELCEDVCQSVSKSVWAALLKVMVRLTLEAHRSCEGKPQVPTPEKVESVLGYSECASTFLQVGTN